MEITRPTITLQVQCGLVRKAQLKEALNASSWEFDKAIKHLSEKDKEFEKAYQPHFKTWSIPEALAIRLVEHVCPGYGVEVVF